MSNSLARKLRLEEIENAKLELEKLKKRERELLVKLGQVNDNAALSHSEGSDSDVDHDENDLEYEASEKPKDTPASQNYGQFTSFFYLGASEKPSKGVQSTKIEIPVRGKQNASSTITRIKWQSKSYDNLNKASTITPKEELLLDLSEDESRGVSPTKNAGNDTVLKARSKSLKDLNELKYDKSEGNFTVHDIDRGLKGGSVIIKTQKNTIDDSRFTEVIADHGVSDFLSTTDEEEEEEDVEDAEVHARDLRGEILKEIEFGKMRDREMRERLHPNSPKDYQSTDESEDEENFLTADSREKIKKEIEEAKQRDYEVKQKYGLTDDELSEVETSPKSARADVRGLIMNEINEYKRREAELRGRWKQLHLSYSEENTRDDDEDADFRISPSGSPKHDKMDNSGSRSDEKDSADEDVDTDEEVRRNADSRGKIQREMDELRQREAEFQRQKHLLSKLRTQASLKSSTAMIDRESASDVYAGATSPRWSHQDDLVEVKQEKVKPGSQESKKKKPRHRLKIPDLFKQTDKENIADKDAVSSQARNPTSENHVQSYSDAHRQDLAASNKPLIFQSKISSTSKPSISTESAIRAPAKSVAIPGALAPSSKSQEFQQRSSSNKSKLKNKEKKDSPNYILGESEVAHHSEYKDLVLISEKEPVSRKRRVKSFVRKKKTGKDADLSTLLSRDIQRKEQAGGNQPASASAPHQNSIISQWEKIGELNRKGTGDFEALVRRRREEKKQEAVELEERRKIEAEIRQAEIARKQIQIEKKKNLQGLWLAKKPVVTHDDNSDADDEDLLPSRDGNQAQAANEVKETVLPLRRESEFLTKTIRKWERRIAKGQQAISELR